MEESEDREAADAAQASLQRRAVEAMGDALESYQTPDLSSDIARILKGQASVLERLEALQKHPALQLTPAQHRQAMVQAGAGVVREAAQQLQRATQEIERERAQLASLVGGANARVRQKRWLAWTAGLALVSGVLLSPLLVRSLPLALSSHAAAFLVKENRWNGGAAMMQLANPGHWPGVVDAVQLVRTNESVLAGCREAAAKAKREQRYTIAVAVP